MRIPTLGETDLLVPLHDGLFEQPMWQTFLTRLRAVTGAAFAVLLLRPPNSAEVVELRSGGREEAQFRRTLAGNYGAEPLQNPAMREGRVYALDELVALGGTAARSFHDDVLVPQGLIHIRSIRVSETGGLNAWLVLIGSDPLGAATASLLTALAPHLRTSLRVFATIERERERSSMSADAFRRMNFGWIAIDARCRIIDLDPQAERLLSQSGLLRRGAYDRLTPASAALDREFAALARDFAASPDGRPRALQLSRDPWIDMLVSPLPERSLVSSAQAVAVVYLRGDRSSNADRCEQLTDLFALSPSEARLAWSMAQGMSIAEAAKEHRLTLETARNYSKKIYAKTGARGQADLVRHILTSVLALA